MIPAIARKDFGSHRKLSRRSPASSGTFFRSAIDRLRTQPRCRSQSGERALAACWLPHFAATNFSFFLTYRPIGAIGKFVKAECLHQHARRVRSPESKRHRSGVRSRSVADRENLALDAGHVRESFRRDPESLRAIAGVTYARLFGEPILL